jgi:hypothetical protein
MMAWMNSVYSVYLYLLQRIRCSSRPSYRYTAHTYTCCNVAGIQRIPILAATSRGVGDRYVYAVYVAYTRHAVYDVTL